MAGRYQAPVDFVLGPGERMLKMTPTERLEFAQRFAAGVQVLRNARRIR